MLLLLLACATPPPSVSPPKLVVLVVLDQFSTFLADRTQPFLSGGLKTLSQQKDGWHGTGHYQTACTWTGPGHATLSTGASPAQHGIAANRWITSTPEAPMVPVNVTAGKRAQLAVSTVAESVLQNHGTVVTFAAKERAAALLAGRDLRAHAYWLRPAENTLQLAWRTDAPEGPASWLPAPQSDATAKDPAELLRSPTLSTNLTNAAIAALDHAGFAESPGADFLAISYSEVDLTAHYFGGDSPEAQAAVLQVDRDLERLIEGLNERLPGQWAMIVTADHGGLPTPKYWMNQTQLKERSDAALAAAGFATQVTIEEPGIWLLGDTSEAARAVVIQTVGQMEGISAALDNRRPIPNEQPWRKQIENCRFQNGEEERSPDVFVLPKWGVAWRDPEQLTEKDGQQVDFGTQHGSPYDYDARVPIWAWGLGVPAGGAEDLDMRRIAPTLTALLAISTPDGATLPPLWSPP